MRALWVALTLVTLVNTATPPRPPSKRPAFPPLRLVNLEHVSDDDQVRCLCTYGHAAMHWVCTLCVRR